MIPHKNEKYGNPNSITRIDQELEAPGLLIMMRAGDVRTLPEEKSLYRE